MLAREMVGAADVAAIAGEWAELAGRAARSPFEPPAWWLPWLRHYGQGWDPFLLTWRRAGRLVAVAPIAVRRRRLRGIPVRELETWGRTGTPLRGWVDLVAEPDGLGLAIAAWVALRRVLPAAVRDLRQGRWREHHRA